MNGKIAYQVEPMKVEIRDYEIPAYIEPGAVLLEIIQTNVCGSDIHVFRGNHPLIKSGGMGHEMIGRIVKLGENVTRDKAGNPVKVGDRIVPVYFATCNQCQECLEGNRSHCEQAFKYFLKNDEAPHFQGATFATHYYVHPDQYFFKIPDSVSNQEASSSNCALSQVMFGLSKINIKPGNTIVIQGAGGLGLNACAVAKERGARVIVIDGVSSRLNLAKRFGAEIVIDMNEYDTIEKRVNYIKALTNDRGADFGLEVTGVPAAISEGIHLVKQNGKYITMGNITIGDTTEIDPGLLVRKAIHIIPVNRYNPEFLYYSLQFLERNKDKYPFGDLVDATFSLEEVEIALEKSASREVARATILVNK